MDLVLISVENFLDLVDTPSTRNKLSITTDRYNGHKVERTTFYKGSKVIGVQIRNVTGYHYYLRK